VQYLLYWCAVQFGPATWSSRHCTPQTTWKRPALRSTGWGHLMILPSWYSIPAVSILLVQYRSCSAQRRVLLNSVLHKDTLHWILFCTDTPSTHWIMLCTETPSMCYHSVLWPRYSNMHTMSRWKVSLYRTLLGKRCFFQNMIRERCFFQNMIRERCFFSEYY